MKKLFLSLISFSFMVNLLAQDTLPKFSVKNVGNNHIIVGWTNNFKTIKQISIQRSFDSVINFKTILTVPDPTTPQNGYLDTKASNDHMFYRLYILLDKGSFIFSEAKRPFRDTTAIARENKDVDTLSRVLRINNNGKMETIAGNDSVASSQLNIKDKNKPDVFAPSAYVFVFKNGYVRVKLPAEEKKYTIKFFEDDGTFLFELKDIKDKEFNIDKSDFYHAGWFSFELYGDGKLIEKHKFYLQKDF